MISNKNILIMTYLHESGLYYLAESLYKCLEKNNFIKYIPKTKFIKENNKFVKKIYNKPGTLNLELNLNSEVYEQIIKYIDFYKIDTIVSFETLMEDSNWIKQIKKRRDIHVIDIPMLEWVSLKYLNNGSYELFDEIWALTNLTKDTFSNAKYNNVIKRTWNFVDTELFYLSYRDINEKYIYYHQSSLNPDHSTKNTDKVIEAFSILNKEYSKTELWISGGLNSYEFDLIKSLNEENQNIKYFDRILSRSEVGYLYRQANCVVAPSSKEGLGLSLYEAQASGCEIITTNMSPMNEVLTKYLCNVERLIKDKTLIPKAELLVGSIYQQMKNVYEENKCQKT